LRAAFLAEGRLLSFGVEPPGCARYVAFVMARTSGTQTPRGQQADRLVRRRRVGLRVSVSRRPGRNPRIYSYAQIRACWFFSCGENTKLRDDARPSRRGLQRDGVGVRRLDDGKLRPAYTIANLSSRSFSVR